MKNWAEADDITQEAFIKLYRFIIKSREEIAVLPWIRKVVVNLCLDVQKSKKWRLFFKNAIRSGEESNTDGSRKVDPIEAIKAKGESPEDSIMDSELQANLDRLVETLSDQQRKIFTMKHFEGLKIKEIASSLDISEGHVKSQLFRAIRTLRKGLGEFYEG